jgi:hypothetical protein
MLWLGPERQPKNHWQQPQKIFHQLGPLELCAAVSGHPKNMGHRRLTAKPAISVRRFPYPRLPEPHSIASSLSSKKGTLAFSNAVRWRTGVWDA